MFVKTFGIQKEGGKDLIIGKGANGKLFNISLQWGLNAGVSFGFVCTHTAQRSGDPWVSSMDLSKG